MQKSYKVSYRKLLPVDATVYRELRLQSLRLHPAFYGSTFEEQRVLPELGLEQAIKRQDTRAFVVGAFADEDLIGICAFVPASDYGLAKTGSLIQLYVKEAFSGQKIGMRLANVLLVEAFSLADVEQVVLEVHPYNGKAVRVYEQAGFRHYEDTRVSPVGQGRLMIACKQRSEQLLSLRS